MSIISIHSFLYIPSNNWLWLSDSKLHRLTSVPSTTSLILQTSRGSTGNILFQQKLINHHSTTGPHSNQYSAQTLFPPKPFGLANCPNMEDSRSNPWNWEIGEFGCQFCHTNSPISEFGKAEVNFLAFLRQILNRPLFCWFASEFSCPLSKKIVRSTRKLFLLYRCVCSYF